MEVQGWSGFGKTFKPEFWIGPIEGKPAHPPMHICFVAESRDQVDEFYKVATETLGATCNGAPGIREIYHPDYYGAFVYDPDEHNIEAACHLRD